MPWSYLFFKRLDKLKKAVSKGISLMVETLKLGGSITLTIKFTLGINYRK